MGGKGHKGDGAVLQDEQSKEVALRRALLSEMRLAEQLRQMSCVAARVATSNAFATSQVLANALLLPTGGPTLLLGLRKGQENSRTPFRSEL